MSLRRALEELPHDRMLESVAREVLGLFYRNPKAWLTSEQVKSRISHPADADRILGLMTESYVLDFEDAPPRYRLVADALLAIEVDRFLRRAERHEHRIQTNVARFRRHFNNS